MSPAAGPRLPAASRATGMWYVLGLAWALIGLGALAWLSAWIAAAVTGGRVRPFGALWLTDLATGKAGRLWPGTPTAVVAAITVVLASVAVTVLVLGWRRVRAAAAGR